MYIIRDTRRRIAIAVGQYLGSLRPLELELGEAGVAEALTLVFLSLAKPELLYKTFSRALQREIRLTTNKQFIAQDLMITSYILISY